MLLGRIQSCDCWPAIHREGGLMVNASSLDDIYIIIAVFFYYVYCNFVLGAGILF